MDMNKKEEAACYVPPLFYGSMPEASESMCEVSESMCEASGEVLS